MVDIEFNEKKHEYLLDGEKALSCTQFIKEFLPPFDLKRISKLVAKKRREQGELNAKGKPINAWNVRKEWKDLGTVASNRGTLIHKELEDWIDSELDPAVFEVLHECSQKGIEWYRSNRKGIPRTEMIVGNKEYLLAGTIDLVQKGAGEVHLVDWKTNKSRDSLNKSYGYIKHPTIEKYRIRNTKLQGYFLQLNIYKRLMELEGYKVSSMTVVHLNEDGPEAYPVPDMSEVVQDMFNKRKEDLKK